MQVLDQLCRNTFDDLDRTRMRDRLRRLAVMVPGAICIKFDTRTRQTVVRLLKPPGGKKPSRDMLAEMTNGKPEHAGDSQGCYNCCCYTLMFGVLDLPAETCP